MLTLFSKLLMLNSIPHFIFAWLSLFPITSSSNKNASKSYTIAGKAQGTTYLIKYLHSDSVIHTNQIDSLFSSLDSSLSLYKNYSAISDFNKQTRGIKYNAHLFNVVHKSIYFYHLSNGTFDITCKPLSTLWGFGKDKFDIPTSSLIKKTLANIGSDKISFSHDSLIKTTSSVKIDCDGIGQGYSVDVFYEFLLSKGIKNFMIEIGGEIRTQGLNEKRESWTVGIEDPSQFLNNDFLVTKVVNITNKAITTSGNYKKYKKLGNLYFSHIIDPIQGRPVNNGIISVTVIADDAITADALDNAFMVMGIEKSFQLVQSLPSVGFYITYKNASGMIADTANNFFKAYLK
jgi:thiamine biosynthesis lipoprotein